jgi:lipopolysaccharide export system protein LptA
MILMMMFSPRSTLVRRFTLCALIAAFALGPIAARQAWAQSAVQGVPNAMQGFSQNRDQPIQIEAATLEMRDKKKEATFAGNVKVVRRPRRNRLRSNRRPQVPAVVLQSSASRPKAAWW